MALESAFTWGAGGAKITPEQLAIAKQVLARRKAQGVDTSPVGHWTAGAARIADALGDVLQEKRLANQESDLNAYNTEQSAPLIEALSGAGVSSPMASASTSGVAQEMAQPSPAPTVDISGDKETFVASLLPAAMEESKRTGVDPRIIVAQAAQETGWGRSAPGNNYFGIKSHGQGGGQNLATHEYVDGKRVNVNDSFRTFESPADSVRGYGDFILKNPRYEGLRTAQGLDGQLQALQASGYATDPNYSRSVGAIARGIRLPETPAAAIEAAAPASSFRGSDYNSPMLTYDDRGARVERPYRDPAVSVQPQAATPQAGFDGGRFGDAPATPTMAGDAPQIYSAQTDFAPELAPPVNVGPAPAVAAVQQPQVTPQPQAQATNTAAIAQALRVMSDPRANEGTRRVAQALLQQEQQKQAAAQEQSIWQQRQQYEQQQQNSDPLRQLQIQKAQQELAGGSRQSLVNAGDGRIYDPNSQQWITAPDAASRNFRQATPDEVKAFGTNGQVGPDGKFYPITPPQGTALSVDPTTGAVTFNQGAGVKPLTEAQSKDSFFTTRMTAATPTIDKFEGALMSLPEAAAGAIPMNLGRYAPSEEYQLAKDAGRDFVNAYLRKDSGAALTAQEEANYGQLLLPQPGDKPAILAAKRQRRQIATEAIKSGMPPSAVDGMLKAIQAVPGADKPAETTSEKKTRTGVQWSID
jgi:flagellum-specific peptidoglycan hydrolase FlgJ